MLADFLVGFNWLHIEKVENVTKEIKRGICVPVYGAKFDAYKLCVVDSAVRKRFVVFLDGGGIFIGYNWFEAEE